MESRLNVMGEKHRRAEKGQATVEFIIIVPMMLLMISLVLFAGWWSYAKLSTQNAAYSYAVWAPLVQTDSGWGRVANYNASQATLMEAIGMKPMWEEDIPNPYESGSYGYTRLGGTGLTVAVSPQGLSWMELLTAWEAVGAGDTSLDMPRGTAFFYYSPLMSADVNPVP